MVLSGPPLGKLGLKEIFLYILTSYKKHKIYRFIAEINDRYVSVVYPPKVALTCLFIVVIKCISSLKKLFLHLLKLLEPPILLKKVYLTSALFLVFRLFLVLQNIFVLSLSGFVCKGVKQHHNRIPLHCVVRSKNH